MKLKSSELTGYFIIFVALLSFVVVRIIVKGENTKWISLVNYVGFEIAIGALFNDCEKNFKSQKRMANLRGLFIILLFTATIIGALIFTSVITLDSTANDLLLLFTLLLSLPTPLYLEWLKRKYFRL